MKVVNLSRLSVGWGAAGQPLKCAVITPIGPGHETLAREAEASVTAAFRAAPGPFTGLTILPMNDLEGKEGRSRRRNDGIDYALENGFDWIFFLDADDLIAPDAFAAVAPYIHDYDAVFGMIAETTFQPGQSRREATVRANQLGATTSLADIVSTDPFLSLQMGHFARTKTAAAVRFDVDMDAGEDFKYYLGLWKQFRCAKIDRVLFINRRGAHSSGPRAADGRKWRETVTALLREFPANK